MKFSPEFIQRVQEANNLIDIISQHTTLKPAGGGLMGRCPFPDHPEKTPSFSVSESKQVYNCFGCHKKGNIFTFLEHYNGMSFPESVEYLAGRANIAMPAVDREQSERLDKVAVKRRQILNLNRLAMEFFYENLRALPQQHVVRQYVTKRGLNLATLDTFKIGYAPPEWDSLLNFLLKKGITTDLLEEAKLIKARTNGSGFFDLFRDRLIFPIFDSKNEVIAFGGRALAANDVKYLNSPETLVFSKSKTLYGLSETAKFVRSEDQAIVVEGYMDLVSLYQAGIQNVVAPMGTALTSEQCRLLRRQTQNSVILFDGDDAGQNAAEKSLPLLLEADIHARGLVLANELDPDEFVRQNGPLLLQNLIKESPDLFSMILQRWMVDYRGEASQKVQLVDRLKPIFTVIQDLRLRDLYISEAAHKLSLDAKWLKSALGLDSSKNISNSNIRQQGSINHQNLTSSQNKRDNLMGTQTLVNSPEKDEKIDSVPDKIQLKGATPAETTLMSVVLKNHANFHLFVESEVIDKILHPGVKKVLERSAGVYRQDPGRFDTLTSLLTTFVDEPNLLFHDQGANSTDNDVRLIQDCVKRIRERFLKFQVHRIGLELKNEMKSNPSEGGSLDVQKLEQIMNLQRDRLSLNKKNQS